MSDFFNSLLNRHRETGDTSATVQPRTVSRFEENYQSPATGVAEESVIRTDNQTAQLNAVKPQVLTSAQQNNSQTVDSTEPSLNVHQPKKSSEKNAEQNSFLHRQVAQQKSNESLISPANNDNKIQPTINNFIAADQNKPHLRQTAESTDTYLSRLNKKLQFNHDASFARSKISQSISQNLTSQYLTSRGLTSQDRLAKSFSDKQQKTANNHANSLLNDESQNSQSHNNRLTHSTEQSLSTNILNQRIQAMLERLRLQSTATHHENKIQLQSPHEFKIRTPKENQASSASINSTVSDDIVKRTNQANANESASDKTTASETNNHSQQFESLEAPSWLANLAAQFSQRIQHLENKAEPVINVTIGRVEVRAVQNSKSKATQQPQRPNGVMSLNDYLKARDSGVQK